MAGSFWRPHTIGCTGSVRLLHTHGKADRTVPLEGREIMPRFVQGNAFEAMDIWRMMDACAAADPDRTETQGIYQVQHRGGGQPGADLQFALHEGGHSVPKGRAQMAVDWFEAQ